MPATLEAPSRRSGNGAGIATGSSAGHRYCRPYRRMHVDPAAARAAEAIADVALVQAVLRGEESARQGLAERLADLPALLRAKHRRLGSPLTHDQIEDVTQNALLAVWAKLATFDGRSSLPAWALGFGTFEMLRAAQRAGRERERSADLPDVVDPRSPVDPDAADGLAAMLRRLTLQDLEILQHKHVAGRTFTEIAAVLGWPTASVKTRYYRALEAIRRRLPGEEGEEP
jgi:RNA polymerase sigma-70 factor (ECF subfamily)